MAILGNPQRTDKPRALIFPMNRGKSVGMPRAPETVGGRPMLFTIAVILLVLWLLGLVSGYTLGNFIYVLLVIALVLFVVGLVSGRRVV
jgi:hypothetical protein